MTKRRRTRACDPEEIIVTIHVWFDCDFHVDLEGGYLVTCRELPEMIAGGKTLRAARANARYQIIGCLEDLAEDGQPIPLTYASISRVKQGPVRPRQTRETAP
jgi:predicted RNase H-like HicB family nuclease